ncbi:MAG: cytidine deaminase [Acidimicrobiia bacterium]
MSPDQLVVAARDAARNAYAPYSNFRVGAAVVTADGDVVTGANVENAAYASGACAEAIAIYTAVAGGARRFATVVVACIDADEVDDAYPCGRCRQVMSEFGVETILVTAGDASEVREHTLDELIPHRFTL